MNATELMSKNLTEVFLEGLKDGTALLTKKWDAGDQPVYSHNFVTGVAYQGVNQWMLMLTELRMEKAGLNLDGDHRWGTYKQALSVGAHVRKGEKAVWCMKVQTIEDKRDIDRDPSEEPLRRKIAIPFPVFHASQIEGLPPIKRLEPRPLDERIAAGQKVVDDLGVPVTHGGNIAGYMPALDRIVMPKREAFVDDGAYMSVLLHECGHATGHASRLNRTFGKFGDPQYALEELRVEMASFDMCRRLRVPFDPSDHIAYVNHWIKALENDPKEIMRAASDADKILTFLKVPELRFEQVPVIEKKAEKEIAEPEPNVAVVRQPTGNQRQRSQSIAL